jgi:hypothetical protein
VIIWVDGGSAAQVDAAGRKVAELARGWGHGVSEVPAGAVPADREGGKVVDPVAVASLVLSIPSAALAVGDLADRIRKRHRAKELIDRAERLADDQVSVRVVTRTRTVEVRGLDPDRLLELLAAEDTDG